MDKITYLYIEKGKDYYDDNAVLKTYQYIFADNNKIIKLASEEDAIKELENIKVSLNDGSAIYQSNGMDMLEDEHGNLID